MLFRSKWFDPLLVTFAKFEINTPLRQAAFVGQCAHESNNFHTLEENLHYSANGLIKTWPSRFNFDNVAKYENQPEKIANKVYAGRMGNGDEESGDGWKYRGRGLIQLTGHDNYKACGEALDEDLLSNPDLVSTPRFAALSAGWFWDKNHLNKFRSEEHTSELQSH